MNKVKGTSRPIHRGRYNEPGADGKDVYESMDKLKEHMKKLKEKENEKEITKAN